MTVSRQRPLLLLDVDGVLVIRVDGEAQPTPGAGPLLARLAPSFELMWNTRHGLGANTWLAPILGLPALPAVDLSAPDCAFTKLPGARRAAGDRAMAWIDDDIDASAQVWAARRPFPTLLVEADREVGLTAAHVERLLAFADSLQD